MNRRLGWVMMLVVVHWACGSDPDPQPQSSTAGAGGVLYGGSGGSSAGDAGQAGSGGEAPGGAGGEAGAQEPGERAPQWLQTFGAGEDDIGVATAVAPDGSVVAVGLMQGKVSFGSEEQSSQGGTDAFVVKLDAQGKPQWSRVFGGTGADGAVSVGIDGQGAIFVGGVFSGTVDFGAGEISSKNESDGFLLRLDPEGKTVWSKVLEGTIPRSLAVSEQGEAWMAGILLKSADLGGGLLEVEGSKDAVYAVYNREGTHVRSARFGGNEVDDFLGISRGIQGEHWLVGTYKTPFDAGAGMLPQIEGENPNVWLVRLSAEGKVLSTRGFGSKGLDASTGVAVGPQGEVVLAMTFEGPSIDLGEGTAETHGYFDAALVKLDASGNTVWTKILGGKLVDAAFNVVVDSAGEIYVSGSYSQGFDLGAGPLQPSAFISNLTFKLGPGGETRWWADLGGAQPNSQTLYGGLALAPSGGVVSVGRFIKQVREIPSAGKEDVFVARFAP